jgi:hypothetical protein
MAIEKWFGCHQTIVQFATKIGSITIRHVATKILVAFGYQWNSWLVGDRKFSIANLNNF